MHWHVETTDIRFTKIIKKTCMYKTRIVAQICEWEHHELKHLKNTNHYNILSTKTNQQ